MKLHEKVKLLEYLCNQYNLAYRATNYYLYVGPLGKPNFYTSVCKLQDMESMDTYQIEEFVLKCVIDEIGNER